MTAVLVAAGAGFVPLSKTGAELLFEVFSQRYERGSILVTSNLPFDEWTEIFGSERLTGALLDRLTHHVHILEMNGESYRLNQSQKRRKSPKIPAYLAHPETLKHRPCRSHAVNVTMPAARMPASFNAVIIASTS